MIRMVLRFDLRLFLTGCLVPGDPQLIGRERDDLNPGPHFLVSTGNSEGTAKCAAEHTAGGEPRAGRHTWESRSP